MTYEELIAKYATNDAHETRAILDELSDEEKEVILNQYGEDATIWFLCDILEAGEQ